MSALSSFQEAEIERIAGLQVKQLKANLSAQEEAYEAQLEHEFNLKMIRLEFKKKKAKELKERRKELEDEIEYIDSILDSL